MRKVRKGAASICFDCKNAVPDNEGHGCPWSRQFEPVPGWTATESRVGNGSLGPIETYCITACPKFDPDDRVNKDPRVAIRVRCVETGAEYSSITKAAKDTGCNVSTVAEAVKTGKAYAGGLHWERVLWRG